MITRCIMCRRDAIVKDRVYIDPRSGDDPTPVWHRGWICDECGVIHWAWPAEDVETYPSDIGGKRVDTD